MVLFSFCGNDSGLGPSHGFVVQAGPDTSVLAGDPVYLRAWLQPPDDSALVEWVVTDTFAGGYSIPLTATWGSASDSGRFVEGYFETPETTCTLTTILTIQLSDGGSVIDTICVRVTGDTLLPSQLRAYMPDSTRNGTQTNSYNADTLLVKKEYKNQNQETVWWQALEYSNRKLVCTKVYHTGYAFTSYYQHEYDAQGRLSRLSVYLPDSSLSSYSLFVYDAQSACSLETIHGPSSDRQYWNAYENDSHGRKTRATFFSGSGDTLAWATYHYEFGLLKEERKYDKQGNLLQRNTSHYRAWERLKP